MRSLAGQMVLLLLFALVLSQVVGFVVYRDERTQVLRDALKEAKEDENVKAVVLRVDSPGGSALASDAATAPSMRPLIVASASMKKLTVEPEPTPTTLSSTTYFSAACATAFFNSD